MRKTAMIWSMVIIYNTVKTWENIVLDLFWGGGAPERWPCYLCFVFLKIISSRNFHLDSPPYKQKLILSPLLCTLHVSLAMRRAQSIISTIIRVCIWFTSIGIARISLWNVALISICNVSLLCFPLLIFLYYDLYVQ